MKSKHYDSIIMDDPVRTPATETVMLQEAAFKRIMSKHAKAIEQMFVSGTGFTKVPWYDPRLESFKELLREIE